MHQVTKLEGWSSPFVEAVTRTRFGSGGAVRMQPGWDAVIFRNGDTTSVLLSGLPTSTVPHDHAAGDTVLAIAIKSTASRLRLD